jgi:cell wall-associated NlpC family hydrolase
MTIQDTLLTLNAQASELIVEVSTLTSLTNAQAQQIETMLADIQKLTDTRLHQIEDLITTAKAFQALGIDYKYGAEYENDMKFDCSAFVQKVFSVVGVSLPRTSASQCKQGTPITEDERGCLLGWDRSGDGTIDHIGIGLGGGKMIHTAKAGEGINVCDWQARYGKPTAIRRII